MIAIREARAALGAVDSSETAIMGFFGRAGATRRTAMSWDV
ncbi:MAG TPA: hypothetical protein VFW64_11485 [Pseudonocardiaceae bacterium]|jgi:hypothetical protein|nr:hypothetical protein [Pseudonocardiaceae bacterium]